MFLILFFSCFLTPTICYPEVMPWGIQNSIGESPYGLNFFEKTPTDGMGGGDSKDWPDAVVPYEFDYTALDGNMTAIKENTAYWLENLQAIMNTTCIRFVPHTNEPAALYITFESGCWSTSSGYDKDTPRHWVSGKCGTHEVLHVLSQIHEQVRRDRDYYIAFNFTNLDPEYKNLYEIDKNWPTFGTIVDPLSTMMYMGWYGHQDNDYPLSIYKDGTDGNSRFIHDFKRYSEVDSQKVNRRYKCNCDDSCFDEDPFNCPVWVKAGGCNDPNWVKNTCGGSCCPSYEDSDCPSFLKEQGPQICNIPSVKENCRVTCNNSCVNQRKDCPYMTATLGCTNNTNNGGMAKYCRKSCGFCTRPVNYKLNPMVITKCTKTCNSECAWKIGSQHPPCVDQDKNCAKIAAQKGCGDLGINFFKNNSSMGSNAKFCPFYLF